MPELRAGGVLLIHIIGYSKSSTCVRHIYIPYDKDLYDDENNYECMVNT